MPLNSQKGYLQSKAEQRYFFWKRNEEVIIYFLTLVFTVKVKWTGKPFGYRNPRLGWSKHLYLLQIFFFIVGYDAGELIIYGHYNCLHPTPAITEPHFMCMQITEGDVSPYCLEQRKSFKKFTSGAKVVPEFSWQTPWQFSKWCWIAFSCSFIIFVGEAGTVIPD